MIFPNVDTNNFADSLKLEKERVEILQRNIFFQKNSKRTSTLAFDAIMTNAYALSQQQQINKRIGKMSINQNITNL